MWLLPLSQNFHLFFSSLQKTSIHQPKSISHKLLSSQDIAHEYVCVCLEDKIVKQTGFFVAHRNPARMPLRKGLTNIWHYSTRVSCSSMVSAHDGKSVFLVDFFASVFPGTPIRNNLLKETQLAALCKNQRDRLSLRSQLLLLVPVRWRQKRTVWDYFSFHPSFTSTPSMPPPSTTTDSPKFLP